MKYLSIDIESTGLDRADKGDAQVIEFAAIIEDTNNQLDRHNIPIFHRHVYTPGLVVGDLYAMFAMENNNATMQLLAAYDQVVRDKDDAKIKEFAEGYNICPAGSLAWEFRNWLVEQQYPGFRSESAAPVHVTLAGKNVLSYDWRMLSKLSRWTSLFRARHRVLDPTVLYLDWHNDETPPGLEVCKQRAGLGDTVSHLAVDDAWDVVQLLRLKYDPFHTWTA